MNMGFIKSVSLDELTVDLAARTGNFSQWIRGKLIEEFSGDLDHKSPESQRDWLSTGKCNPMAVIGCCPLCWPDGIPNGKVRKELFDADVESRRKAREQIWTGRDVVE